MAILFWSYLASRRFFTRHKSARPSQFLRRHRNNRTVKRSAHFVTSPRLSNRKSRRTWFSTRPKAATKRSKEHNLPHTPSSRSLASYTSKAFHSLKLSPRRNPDATFRQVLFTAASSVSPPRDAAHTRQPSATPLRRGTVKAHPKRKQSRDQSFSRMTSTDRSAFIGYPQASSGIVATNEPPKRCSCAPNTCQCELEKAMTITRVRPSRASAHVKPPRIVVSEALRSSDGGAAYTPPAQRQVPSAHEKPAMVPSISEPILEADESRSIYSTDHSFQQPEPTASVDTPSEAASALRDFFARTKARRPSQRKVPATPNRSSNYLCGTFDSPAPSSRFGLALTESTSGQLQWTPDATPTRARTQDPSDNTQLADILETSELMHALELSAEDERVPSMSLRHRSPPKAARADPPSTRDSSLEITMTTFGPQTQHTLPEDRSDPSFAWTDTHTDISSDGFANSIRSAHLDRSFDMTPRTSIDASEHASIKVAAHTFDQEPPHNGSPVRRGAPRQRTESLSTFHSRTRSVSVDSSFYRTYAAAVSYSTLASPQLPAPRIAVFPPKLPAEPPTPSIDAECSSSLALSPDLEASPAYVSPTEEILRDYLRYSTELSTDTDAASIVSTEADTEILSTSASKDTEFKSCESAMPEETADSWHTVGVHTTQSQTPTKDAPAATGDEGQNTPTRVPSKRRGEAQTPDTQHGLGLQMTAEETWLAAQHAADASTTLTLGTGLEPLD